MQVETIQTTERLFEIVLDWDELYRCDPHAHLYLSSDFLCAIAIRMTGNFRVLVAWSDSGRCIGLLPLIMTTQWQKSQRRLVNVLDMLGHVFDADYTGMLCDPTDESAIAKAFADTVAAMSFERIVLNYFSAPKTRLDAFTSAFDTSVFDSQSNEHIINDGQTNNRICPYVDLPNNFDDYLAGLSANTRQKLKRLQRQLDNDPTLSIRKSRPETYTRDVTILSKLWYAKHVQQKGKKRATRLADMFKEVVMLGLANGMVYLAIAWRDDKPVAAQANFIDRAKRQALFHVAGRDESVRDLSVGLMLHAHCIRWAIANGLTRYDFTIGDEPYKYSLGGQRREIFSAEVFTRSGENTTGSLDAQCRDDVVELIRRYVADGRRDDAAVAARQAQETWPELENSLSDLVTNKSGMTV
ncbi:MAG: GNAT family N-acetyltransferase [Pseudomonadota bacterium]